MMSKRIQSLSLLVASAAALAMVSAACSKSKSSGSPTVTVTPTPTPGQTPGPTFGVLTMTSNGASFPIGSTTTSGSHFFAEATSCNLNFGSATTPEIGCEYSMDFVTGTTTNPAYPGGLVVDNQFLGVLIPAATEWVNGTVTLGNTTTFLALEQFTQGAILDSAGNFASGVLNSAGVVFFSTNGSFTLTGIPSTGGTTTGAPFTLTESSHSWLKATGPGTAVPDASVTGPSGTLTGTLNDSCYGVGGSPTNC